MKMIAVLLLSLFALGCAEKKDEVFSLEEANKCLFDSDKKAVLEAVVWIKKADAARTKRSLSNTSKKPTSQFRCCTPRVAMTIP